MAIGNFGDYHEILTIYGNKHYQELQIDTLPEATERSNMSSSPRISVVTVAYNAADTIEETMLSVLSQGYDNLEYIVVDGGSTDGTKEIIERYADRLHWWVSEPDGGQYSAIAKGFEQATGDIYYWINSDDLMLSHTLQVVSEIFTSLPEVEWLSTLRPIVYDELGAMAAVNPIPGFHREAFLRGRYLVEGNNFWGFIQQESTFFSPALWAKTHHVMMDYPLAGDFALWCEMYKHTDLIGTDYPLCGFRARSGQRSLDMERYLSEARMALTRMQDSIGWQGLTLYEKIAIFSNREKWKRKSNPLAPTEVRIVNNTELRGEKRHWKILDRTVWL